MRSEADVLRLPNNTLSTYHLLGEGSIKKLSETSRASDNGDGAQDRSPAPEKKRTKAEEETAERSSTLGPGAQ